MNAKIRSGLFAVFILIFPFTFFGIVLVHQLSAPLPPPPPLPHPNGYDDLIQAGSMASSNSWDYDAASLEQLRETAAANAGALAVARAGLTNKCQVPLQASQDYIQHHITDLIAIRNLAQAFLTEGKLAERENHADTAAQSYLNAICLGNESARGGTLVDQMIGTACESLGTRQLQNIAGQLDAGSCRETAVELETLDAQRQTWSEVLQQEHDWSRRAFTGLRYEIVRLMSHKSREKAFQKAEQKFEEQQVKTRQLMVDLATRAYTLDQGHPPANLTDLVPAYLKAVPQNPLTGTDLVYSPQ
jgi:hypothetical protein